MSKATNQKIRSIDLEPCDETFSYVVINGTPAGRFTHKVAEELRAEWIKDLAAQHDAAS